MAPRKKAHGGKSSSGGVVKASEVRRDVPLQKTRSEESTFKRQAKHAAYRLVAILFVTFLTNYFRSSASTPNELPWKVVDLPGRGKGMIATRLIKRGERIITEGPLFVVPRQITGSPTQLLKSRLESISPEQRTAFFELSYADSNLTEEELPLSIVQTNSISAGESGIGIFPKTARLNHACSSGFNSVYSWREEAQVMVVHALKEVQPGDELLTTYFDTKRPRHERREYLAHAYKFHCQCPVCSLPEDASRASDMRLQSITASLARFTTWNQHEISGLEALNLVRDVWRLSEQEGYLSERGQFASDAAHVAAAHMDDHATRNWAALAQEWYGYELGKDSKQVETMRVIVEAPQRHVAWATRERMQVGDLGHES